MWWITSASSVLIGHALEKTMILIWCFKYSYPEQEYWLVLALGVILPTLSGTGCILAAYLYENDGAVGGDVCRRITVLMIGLLHLMGWHAGYIIAPAALILAGMLPNAITEHVILGKTPTMSGTNTYSYASKKATNELMLIMLP